MDLTSQSEMTVLDIVPRELKNYNDFNVKEKSAGDWNAPVFNYPTLITSEILPLDRKDCRWVDWTDLVLDLYCGGKFLTSHRLGYSFITTYPFSMGFPLPSMIRLPKCASSISYARHKLDLRSGGSLCVSTT